MFFKIKLSPLKFPAAIFYTSVKQLANFKGLFSGGCVKEFL